MNLKKKTDSSANRSVQAGGRKRRWNDSSIFILSRFQLSLLVNQWDLHAIHQRFLGSDRQFLISR